MTTMKIKMIEWQQQEGLPSSSINQLSSPRKSLRARLRLYQAFGKDKISDRRRMSYRKAAVPMSHTAEI